MHLVLGLIAAILPKKQRCMFVGLFLIYQFGQLSMNKRFMPFDLKFKEGNSVEHTINKIGQFSIGFYLGTLMLNLKKKN